MGTWSLVLRGAVALLLLLSAGHARSLQQTAAYPCARTSGAGFDYAGANLETEPRHQQSLATCTALCIQTEQCEGFTLKLNQDCVLKDGSFGTVASAWTMQADTASSTSVKNCTKPAILSPLYLPIVERYPCAQANTTGLDYRTGDLETMPRLLQTVASCTALCVKTEQCQGFSLKLDGRCYLKGADYSTVATDWEADPYTQASVSTKNCPKPAVLLPLRNPKDLAGTPSPTAPEPPLPEAPSSPAKQAQPPPIAPGAAAVSTPGSATNVGTTATPIKQRAVPLGIVIGLVSGILFTLAVLLLVTFCVRRRNRLSKKDKESRYKAAAYTDTSTAISNPSILSDDNGIYAGMQSDTEVFPEIRGLSLYRDEIEDARLEHPCEMMAGPSPSGGSNVHAAIAHFIQHENACIDGNFVLDMSVAPVVGGQAVIAMVSSVYASQSQTFAMKLFSDRATFLREFEVYRNLHERLGTSDDFFVDGRDHGDETLLPNGVERPSYIVLQRGVSMQSWIRSRSNARGKIPNPYEVLWMLSEICHQLRILHDMGFVHRDLKPDNVIFYKAQQLWKIIDFGSTIRKGKKERVECTIRFAAPECLHAWSEKRDLAAHPSMDVWSIGVLSYELITGHRLYPAEATLADMKEMLLGVRLFPHEKDPSRMRMAGEMRKMVQAMLSRSAADRPTIMEVNAKFQKIANGTGAALTPSAGGCDTMTV